MNPPWFGTFILTDHPTYTDITITATPWHEDELLLLMAMRHAEGMGRIVHVWRTDDPPRLIGGWVPHTLKASR